MAKWGVLRYYNSMISKEDIEHLKDLARVEFGEKETEALAEDLAAILGYVAKLNEVNLSGVPEMTYVHELFNIERKDSDTGYAATLINNHETTTSLIEAFPEKESLSSGKEGIFLKVKNIL